MKTFPKAVIKATQVAAVGIAYTGTAFADSIQNGANAAEPNGSNVPTNLTTVFATVSDTLIFLVGAIAVIFLIIGGLRYVISNGDAKQVTAAKDTILYAVIGIIVALIAFALVNFVIGKFTGGS